MMKMIWVAISIPLALGVVGCSQEPEGPAEKAGEQIDEAVEQAKENIDQATEAAAENIEEAGDELRQRAED